MQPGTSEKTSKPAPKRLNHAHRAEKHLSTSLLVGPQGCGTTPASFLITESRYAMNADPTEFIHLADRYGLPLVFLAFSTALIVWAVRAVWGFMKPIASRTAESLMHLLQKQSDFIDTVSTHQQELKALVETGHNGHAKTHEALKNLSAQVGELSRGQR